MADPRRGGSPTLEPRDHQRPPAGGSNSTGARAADGGGGGHRKRGILPLILGLLALLAIAALLAALLGGDDDEQQASQSGQQQQQDGGQAAQGGAGATGGGGELTAKGASILPGSGARIGDAVGETAEGRSVVVQSVVQNAEDPQALEGFWVGSSAQDRVYVEYGGDVGADEADFQPEVGQRVNLTGPVKAAPQETARVLNLDAADARQVEQQGAYVNADEVSAAG